MMLTGRTDVARAACLSSTVLSRHLFNSPPHTHVTHVTHTYTTHTLLFETETFTLFITLEQNRIEFNVKTCFSITYPLGTIIYWSWWFYSGTHCTKIFLIYYLKHKNIYVIFCNLIAVLLWVVFLFCLYQMFPERYELKVFSSSVVLNSIPGRAWKAFIRALARPNSHHTW